jgi:hypothetical protein
MNIGVIEFRNYLLKPGMRQPFFHYFNDHFVDSQEALGAYVLGQYSVIGEDNRFYWVRGFENMKARSHFLPAFYEGKVWEQYGPAANEMMLEWQDVHLLKPTAEATIDISSFEQWKGLLSIQHFRCGNKLPLLQKLLSEEMDRSDQPARPTLWETEMEPNDFPQLPVFQYKDQLTVVSVFKEEEDQEAKEEYRSDAYQQACRLAVNKISLELHSLVNE